MNNHKKITALLAALLTVAVASANATLSDSQLASAKKALKVSTAEMAHKAAVIVAQQPSAQKSEMAVALTRMVIQQKPALAVSVVSEISTVAPEAAPAVAAEAAKLSKDFAEAIAFAAAKAAPQYAMNIVNAVTEAVPTAKLTRVSATRMASAPRASGTGNVVPGSIDGTFYFLPPTSVATPVPGFDPNRYQLPD